MDNWILNKGHRAILVDRSGPAGVADIWTSEHEHDTWEESEVIKGATKIKEFIQRHVKAGWKLTKEVL